MPGVAKPSCDNLASSDHHFEQGPNPPRNSSLGPAAGLRDNLFCPSHVQKTPVSRFKTKRFNKMNHLVVEGAEHDAHMPEVDVYSGVNRPGSRRSMFGRFKDRLNERKSRSTFSSASSRSESREPESERSDWSVSDSSDGRPGHSRERVDRIDPRHNEPQRAQESCQKHRYSYAYPERSFQASTNELTIVHHQTEIVKCKTELMKGILSARTSSSYLQALLDELKRNEVGLERALRETNTIHKGEEKTYTAYQKPDQTQRHLQKDQDVDNAGVPSGARMGFGAQHIRRSHPLFAQMEDRLEVDPCPQSISGRFSSQSRNSRSPDDTFGKSHVLPEPVPVPVESNRQRARYSMPDPAACQRFPDFTPLYGLPKPPPSLLTPRETQRLFLAYNARWTDMPPDDPRIPFPTRDFKADALTASETLWAPYAQTRPLLWSQETVMQANVQAFYLGVVGLYPSYREILGNGRIEMGFDKRGASPERIKMLAELLKKEKMRWHPDRLGRRNNGAPGLNEALQKDVKARAVFHAACELMEATQSAL